MSLARVFPRIDNLDAAAVDGLRVYCTQWVLYQGARRGRDLSIGYALIGTVSLFSALVVSMPDFMALAAAALGIVAAFRMLHYVRMAILLYEAAGIP